MMVDVRGEWGVESRIDGRGLERGVKRSNPSAVVGKLPVEPGSRDPVGRPTVVRGVCQTASHCGRGLGVG